MFHPCLCFLHLGWWKSPSSSAHQELTEGHLQGSVSGHSLRKGAADTEQSEYKLRVCAEHPYRVCLAWQMLPRGPAFAPYVFAGHPNCVCTGFHPGNPKSKCGSLGDLHYRLTLPGCSRGAGCPYTPQPGYAHFWQTLVEKWQSCVMTKQTELLHSLIMLCIKKCLWTYKVIENKGFESSDIQTQTSAVQNCGGFPNWHLAVEQQPIPAAQLLL